MFKDIDIKFVDEEITPFGGLSLFLKMVERCGFEEVLRECGLPEQGSNRGYRPWQLIMGLFAGVWCGASKFWHLDLVRYDYENVVLVEKGSSVDINDYFPFSFGGHKYVVLGMSPQSYGLSSSGMSSYIESLRDLAQQLGCIELDMSMLGPANAFVNTYKYDERLYQYAGIPFWAYEDAEVEGYVYVYSCTINSSSYYYLYSEQSDGTGANRLLVFGRLN